MNKYNGLGKTKLRLRSSGRILWFALPMVSYTAIALSLRGESVLLPASADTSLFGAFPDNNLGASLSLVAGMNGSGYAARELIRFDFTGQIPSNAMIQSVALTLQVIMAPTGGGEPSNFDLHRMLIDWNEGLGLSNSGSPANAGETTWNNRLAPSTPWTSPGGAVSNDFSSTISAGTYITNTGSYTFGSTTNLVADVQQWVRNPVTNFGWIILSEAEDTPFSARRFGSRENTGSAPGLLVQYALPVAALAIDSIKFTNKQVEISFMALAEQTCVVQYRDSLGAGPWVTLTNLPPQNGTDHVVVVDPVPSPAQRFYRVEAP